MYYFLINTEINTTNPFLRLFAYIFIEVEYFVKEWC